MWALGCFAAPPQEQGVPRDRGHLTLLTRCWTQHQAAEQPGSGRMGACWAPCSWLSLRPPVTLGQGGRTQRELSSYGWAVRGAEWCAWDTLGRVWIHSGYSALCMVGERSGLLAWLLPGLPGCEGSHPAPAHACTPLSEGCRSLPGPWRQGMHSVRRRQRTSLVYWCSGIFHSVSPALAPTWAGCSGECSPPQAVEQAAP